MPYDEFLDISLKAFTKEELDALDKDAEHAEKALERKQKALERSGGIFGIPEGKALPKSTIAQLEKSKLERDSRAVGEQIPKGVLTSAQGAPVKRFNLLDEIRQQREDLLHTILTTEFDASTAQQAISFLKDPINGITTQVKRILPEAAAAFIGLEVAKTVIDWLTKKGGWLDQTFRDTITTLKAELRDKMVQSSVRAGFTQIIINTAGGTNPRNSYNTYFQYNYNNRALEDAFSVRNTRAI